MPSAAQALFCVLLWASKRVRRSRGARPPGSGFDLQGLTFNGLILQTRPAGCVPPAALLFVQSPTKSKQKMALGAALGTSLAGFPWC